MIGENSRISRSSGTTERLALSDLTCDAAGSNANQELSRDYLDGKLSSLQPLISGKSVARVDGGTTLRFVSRLQLIEPSSGPYIHSICLQLILLDVRERSL